MEFDKSKVYTALNADELKPGSNVIVSNCISELKELVANYKDEDARELISICSESSLDGRFETKTNIYHFAYLISVPEVKDWIAYLCRKGMSNPEDYYLTCCKSDRWEQVKEENGAKTKLFEGTEDECEEWYTFREHLTDVIAAWEDGKTIQFYENSTGNWHTTETPGWSTSTRYRIKPSLKWTDLKIGDIIQNESHTHSKMIIGIDHREESKSHIFVGETWLDDDDLEYWEKV